MFTYFVWQKIQTLEQCKLLYIFNVSKTVLETHPVALFITWLLVTVFCILILVRIFKS